MRISKQSNKGHEVMQKMHILATCYVYVKNIFLSIKGIAKGLSFKKMFSFSWF